MTITFTDVSASYEKKADAGNVLSGLNLTVSPGMRIALLGENGSGKTSLLKVLTGILPYEGSIRIDGKELRTLHRRNIALRIAHLAQVSGAYFSYTVAETVSHGRYLRQKGNALFHDSKEDDAAVAGVLEKTGLTDVKDRPIDTLSGGQLQRVFLARAFAQETPVLLLDEPTSHLDLKYQAELADYLFDWSTQQTHLPDGSVHDNTLIGVFHDLALAKKIATDVLLLKDGRMLAYGDADRIFSDRDLLTKAFDFDVLTYLRELTL